MVGALVGGVCEHLPSAAWELHPELKIEFWYPHTHPAVAAWPSPQNWLLIPPTLHFSTNSSSRTFSSKKPSHQVNHPIWCEEEFKQCSTLPQRDILFCCSDHHMVGFMFNVHIPITSFRDPYDLQWPGSVMALLTRFNVQWTDTPPLSQLA